MEAATEALSHEQVSGLPLQASVLQIPRGDGPEVNVLKQPLKQPHSPYCCARAGELLSVTGTKDLQAQRKLLSQKKKAACGDRSSEPGACLHCGTWGNAEQLEPEFPI